MTEKQNTLQIQCSKVENEKAVQSDDCIAFLRLEGLFQWAESEPDVKIQSRWTCELNHLSALAYLRIQRNFAIINPPL